jgi:4-methyl-5(b-hydroxyethyl)-thiazole monophosphate biosynthesis
MPTPTILVLLAEGFEEVEALTPVDILRRAGAEVTVAALGDGIHVRGRSGIVVHADTILGSLEGREFDCLLLPGGPGVTHLRQDARVLAIATRQMKAERWTAAICAAPVVLNAAGLLEGRRFTAHHSVAGELPGIIPSERVVIDGCLITSRGAGTALDFALSIVGQLFTREKASQISRDISA